MQAVILSIGDELVLGQTVDSNSAYLSAQLAQHGIGTRYHQTVPDDQEAIAGAIQLALGQVELLILSGGLGPTEDDLTRQALADALGEPLVLDEPSVEHIRRFFRHRGRDMPQRNKSQAMHPRGTTVIPNPHGTAPGVRAVVENTNLFAIPGVPREMVQMFNSAIRPHLDAIAPGRHVILTTKVNSIGLGESDAAERLGPLMARERNPKVGTTVSDAIVSVRVRSEFSDPHEARQQLNATVAEVEQRLGPIAFGRDDETVQHVLVSMLADRDQTLATAESCTGGLLSTMVTDVPGSSAVYRGGWVAYRNAMKIAHLGIPQSLLERHGAVSQPVACRMATGALKKGGTDLAAAITGIAGPDGGTKEKPVGTVWIAMAYRQDSAQGRVGTDALLLQLVGDRPQVRDLAAKAALQMLRLHLKGEPIDLMQWGQRVPMDNEPQ